MGQFDIKTARQELGFTPSTAVRANIDVRGTGGSDAAIGQALVGAAKIGLDVQKQRQEKSEKQRKLEEKLAAERQKKLDVRSQITAESFITIQEDAHKVFKDSNADTKLWPKDIEDRFTVAGEQISSLEMSDDIRLLVNTKLAARLATGSSTTFGDATLREIADTKDSADLNYIEAVQSNNAVKIQEATRLWRDAYSGTVDEAEQRALFKELSIEGLKLRAQNASNAVYAAIEAATDPEAVIGVSGDFEAAKELAKNPSIPESKQATLRSAINTAQTAQQNRIDEQRQNAINKATSTAIRESFQGTLTIGELDRQHEAGLIRDSEFKSMRKGLADKIPEQSNPLVRSEMSGAISSFKSGQISEQDAQGIFLDSLSFLSALDRAKFDNDIALTSTKLIETGMSNAKASGASLISPRFQEFDPFGVNKFKDSEDAKRFNLEWRNRNQYEDALDEWKEAQKDKDITPRDIRLIENDLLIEFRKTKNLQLDQLEARVVSGETKKRTPLVESKTLKELTKEKADRESLRPDGTKKGNGFLGKLQLKGGDVATEFSFGTTDVTGKEINIPSLVPTLTKTEISLMKNDIIPNNKSIPKAIIDKAISHAKKRISEGKSVFADTPQQKVSPSKKQNISKRSTEDIRAEIERLRKQ